MEKGEERIRLQAELSGDTTRVWVAVSPNITIRELATAVSAQYAKVRGTPVVVDELTLRGALLDPDERVGFWVKDQELLYATTKKPVPVKPKPEVRAASSTSPAAAVATGATANATAPASGATSATAAAPSEGKQPLAVSANTRDGILVSHEVPLHQVMALKELAPQTLTLAVLGADHVGKTTFVRSFISGMSGDSAEAAQVASGATSEKKIEVDGVVHRVIVVDADYALVEDPTRNVFTGAQAFFFLFDVESRASFDALKDRLLGFMVASRGHDPTVPVTIVANKSDKEGLRAVTARETLALAQELSTLIKGSVALYETSAARGTNVVDAFQDTFLNVLHWRTCDKKNVESAGSCIIN